MKKLVKIGLLVPMIAMFAFATVSLAADPAETSETDEQQPVVNRVLSDRLASGDDQNAETNSDDAEEGDTLVEPTTGREVLGTRTLGERRGRLASRGRVVADGGVFSARAASATDGSSSASSVSSVSDSSDKSGKSDSSEPMTP